MEICCVCSEAINNSGLKEYLPTIVLIVVAIIGVMGGLEKIKLENRSKLRMKWIKELRDVASKYNAESNQALTLFYIYKAEWVYEKPQFWGEKDKLNYDKYLATVSKADALGHNLRLLLNPSNNLHFKAEHLFLELEESINLFYESYTLITENDLEKIKNGMKEIQKKIPRFIVSIQAIIVEETEKANNLFA